MQFSVCVDALYYGKDLYASIEELAKAGVKNIEFWSWWDKDLDRLLELKERYGLRYVGLCSRWFSMIDPAQFDDFVKAFAETVSVCERLGCKAIYVKPGDRLDMPFEEQYQNIVKLLKACLAIAAPKDVTILLEPVSYMEAPKTILGDSTLGFQIVKEIGDPHLKLLYDLYHMQLDEGDVVRRVTNNLEWVGHIHAAGIAERHELPDGELDYDYVFRKITGAGYQGLYGLEYFPAEPAIEGVKKVLSGEYR